MIQLLYEYHDGGNMVVDFLGDISLAHANLSLSEQKSTAISINKQLGECDFRIANLESPMLISHAHIESLKEEEGEGAHLCMYSDAHSTFFDTLDVNAYTLANNHIFDYGESGLKDTIEWMVQRGKKYAGASTSENDAYEPLIVEDNDAKLAVYSICENEFGIAVGNKAGAAGVNYKIIFDSILAWGERVDGIIIVFHGGNEYYPFPSPRQKELYHRLVDIGADMIIGMHSHCPVGKEIYKGKELYYGLGNFFFPKKSFSLYPNDNYGYVVRVHLENKRFIASEIFPYNCDDAGRKWGLLPKTDLFFEYFQEISDAINDDNRLNELFRGWAMYYGETLYRRLSECFQSENDIYSQNIIKNFFSCESHNELLTEYLNTKYYFSNNRFDSIQDYIKSMIGVNTKCEKDCDEVVWGCTEKSHSFVNKEIEKGKKVRVVDSNVYIQGLYFYKLKVCPPLELPDVDIYIGTSRKSYLEIQKKLVGMSISAERIKWIE